MESNRLLTTEEAAERLRLPVNTLYGWRYARKGPPAFLMGRHLRWPESELESWIAARIAEGRACDAT